MGELGSYRLRRDDRRSEGYAVRDGRMSGFDELYRREYPKLAGYAYTLLRNEELAHDVTQEAFTRLFARIINVREPRPFLFRVVTNLANDHWRRAAKESGRPIEEMASVPEIDRERALDLRGVLARLPERHRVVVVLHYFADLSVEQIAKAVDRPQGSVKRMLHEARAQLAEHLAVSDE